MKKLLSLVISIIIATLITVPAFATEPTTAKDLYTLSSNKVIAGSSLTLTISTSKTMKYLSADIKKFLTIDGFTADISVSYDSQNKFAITFNNVRQVAGTSKCSILLNEGFITFEDGSLNNRFSFNDCFIIKNKMKISINNSSDNSNSSSSNSGGSNDYNDDDISTGPSKPSTPGGSSTSGSTTTTPPAGDTTSPTSPSTGGSTGGSDDDIIGT